MSGFGFNEIFGNIFATTRIESNWDLAKRWGRIASVGYQVYNSLTGAVPITYGVMQPHGSRTHNQTDPHSG